MKIKDEINNVGAGPVSAPKGITLIALVITIIVLLILAGITISLTIGEHGILNMAKEAGVKTEKQTAIEVMSLKIANIQTVYYAENKETLTLQYVVDKLREDNDIAYANLENTFISTKLEKYPYEFKIDSLLEIVSIDGMQIENTSKGQKEINISSNGTYTEDVSEYSTAKINVNVPGNGWTYVEVDVPEDGSDTVLDCGYRPEVIYGHFVSKDETINRPFIVMGENNKTFGFDGATMSDWSTTNYLTSTGYVYTSSKESQSTLRGSKMYLWIKQ